MFSAQIVEAVDVFEEGDLDLTTGLPVAAPDQLGLKGFEEAFDGGIVVTISFSAHRHLEPVLAQKLLVVMTAVLRAAIRVMNAARRWPADRDGHVQCPEREILLHAVTDGPSDHASREEINDHNQIHPTFARPDIGDIIRPLLVRPARREVLLQEIRRDIEGVVAVGGALELPTADDLDTVQAHQTAYATLADTKSQLVQLRGHAGPAVAAQALAVLLTDMGEEHHVTSLAMRRRPVPPGS